MRAVTSMLTVSLLVPLAALSAQEQPPVEAGSRIRVTAPTVGADELVGMCVEVDATRLRVQAEEQASPLTISLTDVTRLEVSQGRKSNALAGLGIGFLGGAAIGAVLGSAAGREEGGPETLCTGDKTECAVFGAAVGGVAFGAIGAGIGALAKTERWEEVPLDRLRVSIVPLRDGRFALGLSVRF
jgi:hypothetical protein